MKNKTFFGCLKMDPFRYKLLEDKGFDLSGYHTPTPSVAAILTEINKTYGEKAQFSQRALNMVKRNYATLVGTTQPIKFLRVLEEINSSSSAGWPTGFTKGSVLDTTPLARLLKSGEEMHALGRQVFYGFPKNEFRPLEKEYVHGIFVQPLGGYLWDVAYSFEFNKKIYSQPLKSLSAVGLAKGGPIWDHLGHNLLKRTPKGTPSLILCWDISRANCSCPPEIIQLDIDTRVESMGERHRKKLGEIAWSAYNAIVRDPEGNMHEVASLLSGKYTTTSQNTMQNEAFWAELAIEMGYRSLDTFREDHYAAIYSDDGIASFSGYTKKELSEILEHVAAQCNLTIKYKVVEDLTEAEFLGETFVRSSVNHKRVWLPYPTDLRKVAFSAAHYEIRKDGSPRLSDLQVAQGMVQNLARLSAKDDPYLRFQEFVLKMFKIFSVDKNSVEMMYARMSPAQSRVVYFSNPLEHSLGTKFEEDPLTCRTSFHDIYTAAQRDNECFFFALKTSMGSEDKGTFPLNNSSINMSKTKTANKRDKSKPLLKKKSKPKKVSAPAKSKKKTTITQPRPKQIRHASDFKVNKSAGVSYALGRKARVTHTAGSLTMPWHPPMRVYQGSNLWAGFRVEYMDDQRLILHIRQPIKRIASTASAVTSDRFFDVDDTETFPRAAQIMKNFKQWRPLAMKMTYEPMCPITQSGRVQIYWDPDPDSPIATEIEDVVLQPMNIATPVWQKAESLSMFMSDEFSNDWKYIGDASAPDTDRYFGRLIFTSAGATSEDEGAFAGLCYMEATIECITASVPIGNSSTFRTPSQAPSVEDTPGTSTWKDILDGIKTVLAYRSGDVDSPLNGENSEIEANYLGDFARVLTNNQTVNWKEMATLVSGLQYFGATSSASVYSETVKHSWRRDSSAEKRPFSLPSVRYSNPQVSARYDDEELLDILHHEDVCYIENDEIVCKKIPSRTTVPNEIYCDLLWIPRGTGDIVELLTLSHVGSSAGYFEFSRSFGSSHFTEPGVFAYSIYAYDDREPSNEGYLAFNRTESL